MVARLTSRGPETIQAASAIGLIRSEQILKHLTRLCPAAAVIPKAHVASEQVARMSLNRIVLPVVVRIKAILFHVQVTHVEAHPKVLAASVRIVQQ